MSRSLKKNLFIPILLFKETLEIASHLYFLDRLWFILECQSTFEMVIG